MDEQKRYSQYEKAWNKSEKRVNTELQLAQGFNVADIYLNRTYLESFASAPIVPTSKVLLDPSYLRLIEITKLVFDKNEKFTDKLKSVYSALHSLDSSVALIIDSDGIAVHFYIGIRSTTNVAIAEDVLESTLKGNFPGISYKAMSVSETDTILTGIRKAGIKSLASVSMVPSMREDNFDTETFVQGIEKFIDTMNGKNYTAVCLATPLDDITTKHRKHGYEELCSSLSPHAKLSIAFGENESFAVNESISASFSKSVNRSVSNSNTNSTSRSSGTNSSRSGGTSSNFGFSGAGDSGGWNAGWSNNDGWSNGSFDSYTSGNSFTQSISDSEGSSTTDGRTRGTTETKGASKTITLTYENKGVITLMERAQAELERFKICESFGMWEFCGYFMSKDIHTTVLSGNVYRALMTGDNSNIESAHLNIWSMNQIDTINKIIDYILHFSHPQAEMPAFEGGYAKQLVTPTNIVSGHELPLVMGFPKKSVSGLAVVEMAEFGRAVVYENQHPDRTIEFGSIYHMGVVENTRIRMALDLLASHCFITGSSGSGKSYATYQLLDCVLNEGVKMMVIEPAKGEYKQVFGGLKGIKIFTTDPNAYRILKINPFQFPENMHILSHIEQLLQIFNASWPLYAAMPAILKQAVNEAYVKCGWDIQNSIWIPGICEHKYPVFSDVLDILPNIINQSDYSADSKGDYKGALVTRVQSMTVGINGLIFKNNEGIEDSILFDSNVIVDLSELGSNEVIALVMGVLIMKLNEYRKSQRKSTKRISLNSELKHVTILEEAHNLLKRTSKEQSQDGANMVGKSVEMISNSIKEMRTYGEGFIIIDQSPMAVDSSAIENTATKIIMNTPAKDACEELGSALSLNEKQTAELSRLNVGVAAVFQKGWLSPVLMKVDKWDNRYNSEVEYTNQSLLRVFKGNIVSALIEQQNNGRFSPMKLRGIIKSSNLTADKKREIDEIITSYNERLFATQNKSRAVFGRLVMDIVECEYLFEVIPTDGVPTYDEFLKYDSNSKEFSIMVKKYKASVSAWFEKMFDALELYLVLDSDKVKTELILFLIYIAGVGGQIKYNRKNKLAMICRLLFREFGVNIVEV
jgi:nucleoside-triphosphatase THEP1